MQDVILFIRTKTRVMNMLVLFSCHCDGRSHRDPKCRRKIYLVLCQKNGEK